MAAKPRSAGQGERVSRRLARHWPLLVLSARPVLLARRSPRFAVSLVLRLAGVGLLAWIGDLHWRLWQLGYGDLPTLGPMFLADAVVAVVLAAVLLVWPRPVAGLACTGFTAVTIGALAISLEFGLFGFREVITTTHVVQALALESLTVVILAAWTLLAAWSLRAHDR